MYGTPMGGAPAPPPMGAAPNPDMLAQLAQQLGLPPQMVLTFLRQLTQRSMPDAGA